MATVTFDEALPDLTKEIIGQAFIWIYSYITAAGIPLAAAMHFIGHTEDDVDWSPLLTYIDVPKGPMHRSVAETVIDTITLNVTGTLRETPIDILGLLTGGLPTVGGGIITAMSNVGSDVGFKELALGLAPNDDCPTKYFGVMAQVHNEGVAGCDGNIGFIQIPKATGTLTGPLAPRRGVAQAAPFEFKAFHDDSITPVVLVGPGGGALGPLGRYHATLP